MAEGGMRPRFLKPETKDENKPDVAMGATEPVAAVEAVATGSPKVELTFDQLQALIASAAANRPSMDAESLAKAFQKANRPENVQAPMRSVYNPRGETEHPKPAFVAKKVTQNRIELDRDVLTWEEIEAINALKPGEYRVQKADGVRIPFTVKFVRGFDEQTVERCEIHYPCRDEHREGHRGLFEYCVDVVAQSDEAEADRLTRLRRELDRERAAMHAA